MRPGCRNCELREEDGSNFVLAGNFFRHSDSTSVQRFQCLKCKTTFSKATFHPCFRQKKRTKNHLLKFLLCSGVSQRRAAKILHLNRKTIVRKFLFLALEAEFELRVGNLKLQGACRFEFDDLETTEHTKLKPLSITLAVQTKTRRILGLEVSSMPCKGPLAAKSREKYGPRIDERAEGRKRLFEKLKAVVTSDPEIKSDSNPHYRADVARHFPNAHHKRYLGKRGSLGGQGELKKVPFDPLFSLNHTCAMFRANVNRLFRKTWCTTKRADRLYAHLILYASFHNSQLIP